MANSNSYFFKAGILSLIMILGFGCMGLFTPETKISDIKSNPNKYMGEKVTVKGMVKNTLKVGEVSGFSLVNGGDMILVSSDSLPAEGKNVTVTGVVDKNIVGVYIIGKEIN